MKTHTTTRAALLLVLLTALIAVPAQSQEAEYEGEKNCKVCHNKASEGEQWNKWNAEKHSKAFDVLKTEAAIAAAKERGITGPPSEAAACLKCHVTGYDEAAGKAPAKILPSMGVQCESCHGPSSEHVAAAKQFKLKKITLEELTGTRVVPNEQNCLQCHNEESPTWNPERYTKEDGTTTGFDFEQAFKVIAHPNPEKQKSEAKK